MNDIERQIRFETNMVYDASLRHAKNRDFQLATDFRPAKDLVGNCLDSLSSAIRELQMQLQTSEYRKLPIWGTPFLSLSAEQHALITLSTLVNWICRSQSEDGVAPPRTPVAYDIGEWCRIERMLDCAEQRGVDVALQLRSRNNNRNARRRADEYTRRLDNKDDWDTDRISHHLGEKNVSLALQHARFAGQPIFEVKMTREGVGKRMTTTERIALTPAAAEWLANHPSALASLPAPVYAPMVVPPRPFTSHSADGGYLRVPLKLLKDEPRGRAQKLFRKADFSRVLVAVNALQNTDYRLNNGVCEIMRRVCESGQRSFGLQTFTAGELRAHKHLMALRMPSAERFLRELHIYFPWQLDHRGRAYPVPPLIHPQSNHWGKSLLEFGVGKELGERGAYWLKIHIANCFWKGKKVSFEERIGWFDQHEQEILAFAGNPLGDCPLRDKADKPWLFFAACLEWKRYREVGPGFRSHLPISMDGSCNGYQHLSALGRDPFGGSAVNLVPDDYPHDIYLEVAEILSSKIQIDAQYRQGDDREAARQLLGKIDRDLVKPATMTIVYGATRGTIYRQLLDTKVIQSCEDPEKCARYLARILEETIPDVAVEAGRIMKWLRAIARTLAKAGMGMAWTSPAGFPVVHEIREPKEIRITTADKRVTLHVEDPKRKIDWRAQVNGVVAHLVHSLDAAHMMLTVNRLHSHGLRHFLMVHDSFGVHAADVDLLNRVLREEFVGMYSELVMANFFMEVLMS
ncbi:MAG TPA: DNA-directed RNA polymerase, partial [Terriglobia bacterium]